MSNNYSNRNDGNRDSSANRNPRKRNSAAIGRKKMQAKRKALRAKRVRRTLLVITEFVLVCALSICCYGVSLLNSMQRSTIDTADIYIASFDDAGNTTPSTEIAQALTESLEEGKVEVTTLEELAASQKEEQTTAEQTKAPVVSETISDVLSHQETVNGFWNVLIIGVDARDQAELTRDVQSDVMIICSINVRTKEIKLASVYRDTLLKMYSNGTYNKANDELAKTNIGNAVSMINMNLDLQIQDAVVVNWLAVINVIDALGGIELNITEEEVSRGIITGYITEIEQCTGKWEPQITTAGYQLCNGTWAVAYCRNRYTTNNDYGRTERQREVIQKILEKAKMADLGSIINALKYALPNISVTLSNEELYELALDVSSYTIVDTTGFPFEYTANIKEVFGVKDPVIPKNLAANVQLLHQFLFGADVSYSPSNMVQSISNEIINETGVQ